jgi:two-component system phosphate regulon response regulator PhoB
VFVRPRKRILLVEDDTDLARLYRGVLRMAGFDARHASDGWSALRAIHDERPDVLVVDIHVPGLRGDELLTELSSHPETRQIPAIVVTGTDIDLAVAQVKQVLRKPCAPERLVSVIERFAAAA